MAGFRQNNPETCVKSEQPDNPAIRIYVNHIGRWDFRQTGHCHDISTQHHNKFSACGKLDFADIDGMAGRRTTQNRICRE